MAISKYSGEPHSVKSWSYNGSHYDIMYASGTSDHYLKMTGDDGQTLIDRVSLEKTCLREEINHKIREGLLSLIKTICISNDAGRPIAEFEFLEVDNSFWKFIEPFECRLISDVTHLRVILKKNGKVKVQDWDDSWFGLEWRSIKSNLGLPKLSKKEFRAFYGIINKQYGYDEGRSAILNFKKMEKEPHNFSVQFQALPPPHLLKLKGLYLKIHYIVYSNISSIVELYNKTHGLHVELNARNQSIGYIDKTGELKGDIFDKVVLKVLKKISFVYSLPFDIQICGTHLTGNSHAEPFVDFSYTLDTNSAGLAKLFDSVNAFRLEVAPKSAGFKYASIRRNGTVVQQETVVPFGVIAANCGLVPSNPRISIQGSHGFYHSPQHAVIQHIPRNPTINKEIGLELVYTIQTNSSKILQLFNVGQRHMLEFRGLNLSLKTIEQDDTMKNLPLPFFSYLSVRMILQAACVASQGFFTVKFAGNPQYANLGKNPAVQLNYTLKTNYQPLVKYIGDKDTLEVDYYKDRGNIFSPTSVRCNQLSTMKVLALSSLIWTGALPELPFNLKIRGKHELDLVQRPREKLLMEKVASTVSYALKTIGF